MWLTCPAAAPGEAQDLADPVEDVGGEDVDLAGCPGPVAPPLTAAWKWEYDPIHYLPFLERKTGALDQVAPLQGWALPEEFGTLRRLLESRMGRRGKREFVQVLRLLETFSQEECMQ